MFVEHFRFPDERLRSTGFTNCTRHFVSCKFEVLSKTFRRFKFLSTNATASLFYGEIHRRVSLILGNVVTLLHH